MPTSTKLNDFNIVRMPQNVRDKLGNKGADKLHVITKDDNDTNLEVYSAQRVDELMSNVDASSDSIQEAIQKYATQDVSATLRASGWTGSSAPYTYTLTHTAITANNDIILSLVANPTDEQVVVAGEANIKVTGQADGSITITANGTKPSIDLPVTLLIMGISGEGNISGDTPITSLPSNLLYMTTDSEGNIIIVNGDETNITEILRNTLTSGASELVPLTLLASGWTGSSAPYTYIINNNKITADNDGVINIGPNASDDQIDAFSDANITVQSQGNGSLTIIASSTKPTIDIPITLLILGSDNGSSGSSGGGITSLPSNVLYLTTNSEGKIIIVNSENADVTNNVREALAIESSEVASLTIFASGWTGSSAPYTYQLNDNRITANNNGIINLDDDATNEQIVAADEANIEISNQSLGTITLIANGTKPTIDIPINVVFLGSNSGGSSNGGSNSVIMTLTASGWSGNNVPYTQTLSNSNITSNGNGSIGVANTATVAQRNAAASAGLLISSQSAGSITITANSEKPSVDIPVLLQLY